VEELQGEYSVALSREPVLQLFLIVGCIDDCVRILVSDVALDNGNLAFADAYLHRQIRRKT